MQVAVAVQHGINKAVKAVKVAEVLVEHQALVQDLTEQANQVQLTEVAVQVRQLDVVKWVQVEKEL